MDASLLNTGIFSAEKVEKLRQMMNDLQDVWNNASDELLPFFCRNKTENVVVSVIMPVYNVEKFLVKAMQSIVNQTLKEIEIICVDDGSTDRCPEILAFFAAHDERVKVITQQNSNAGVSRNRGMDIAQGQYLYFVDSDDWCVPRMLKTAVDVSKKDNCDLVAWSYQTIDHGTRQILAEKKFKDELLGGSRKKYLFNYLGHCVWHKLFRRQMILDHQLRYQEITNANDAAFSMCSVAVAKRIKTIAEPMYFYRKSGTGLQASIMSAPFCCIKALIHTKNEMRRLGVLESFQEPLRNTVYGALASQLSRLPFSFEQLIEIRTVLNENFDYANIKFEDAFDKDAYFFVQSMFFSNSEFYPTKFITLLRERQKTINLANRELEKLQTVSPSNTKLWGMKWIFGKIRAGFRCLKDNGFLYTCKRVLQKIRKKSANKNGL